MGSHLEVVATSILQIRIYFLFVFLAFLYLINKNKNNSFHIFILLIFFDGLVNFISKDIYNLYRIFLVFLTIYWLYRKNVLPIVNRYFITTIIFLFFTLVFLISAFINKDYFSLTFSQYSKFFILFALFLIFIKNRYNTSFKEKLTYLIYSVLTIQIFVSVVKFFIIGARESIVGTIGAQGGALATTLPILGFIFLWIRNNGVFTRKDWWFVIGLAFIGFVSQKRAIWFILPVVIGLFMFYIPKNRVPRKLILIIIIVIPFMFYAGVRLNKTLNKEHKVGGSFDLEYVYNYANNYMFGKESMRGGEIAYGRGSATILLFNKLISGENKAESWFGYGLRYMYTTTYDQFNRLGFALAGKGSATGVFQGLITGGYIGIFAYILFAISIISKTKNKRLRLSLFLFFFWEYLFYTGIIFRSNALGILFLYAVVFSEREISLKLPKLYGFR